DHGNDVLLHGCPKLVSAHGSCSVTSLLRPCMSPRGLKMNPSIRAVMKAANVHDSGSSTSGSTMSPASALDMAACSVSMTHCYPKLQLKKFHRLSKML